MASAACLEYGLLINSNTAIKVTQTGRDNSAPCRSARTGIPFACNLSIRSGKCVLECNNIITSSGVISPSSSAISIMELVFPSHIFVELLLNNACNLKAISSCSNSDAFALGLSNAKRGFNKFVSGVLASN